MPDQMSDKTYTLLGPDGPYESPHKGTLGGYCADKPVDRKYGTMDCPAARSAMDKGGYVERRRFFADDATAIASKYRPCGRCMPERYNEWKAGGQPGTSDYPWLVTP